MKIESIKGAFAALTVLELILSVVFLTVAYLIGSDYIRGVGVGLTIAWVTGALAYIVVSRRQK
jgi:hypothetical protein